MVEEKKEEPKKEEKKKEEYEYEIVDTPPEIDALLDSGKKGKEKENGGLRIGAIPLGSLLKIPKPKPKNDIGGVLDQLNEMLRNEDGVIAFLQYMEAAGIEKILKFLVNHTDSKPEEYAKKMSIVGKSLIDKCAEVHCSNGEILASTLIGMAAVLGSQKSETMKRFKEKHDCSKCNHREACKQLQDILGIKLDGD